MTANPPELERLPPNNKDAERQLLGSVLRDPMLLPEVVTLIRADDFYLHAHQIVFEAMATIADTGREVDIVTIADWIARNKTQGIEDIGGYAYLAGLWDTASSAGLYRQYCEIIREASVSRSLMHAAKQIHVAASDQTGSAAELIGEAEQHVLQIAERTIVSEVVSLEAAIRETYEQIDSRNSGLETANGVPTGFVDLDAIIAGFRNGELVVVGARPSCGKTALSLAFTAHAALNEGMPVLFVSLEQSRTELSERLLCMTARIDGHRLRKGWINQDERQKLMEAGDRLSQAKVFIDDTPGQNMLRIAANARRLHRRHALRLVIVDYIQLIEHENHRASRQEQVSSFSRRLKCLARELKVPVVALSQLNRQTEEGPGREPRLSDLRESGSIEQDSDTVMLMHRTAAESSIININVAKQRNGPRGNVQLMFQKEFMLFQNMAHSTQDEM